MQEEVLVRFENAGEVSLKVGHYGRYPIWQPYKCEIGTRRGLLRAIQGLCKFNWITTQHVDQLIALSAKNPSKKV